MRTIITAKHIWTETGLLQDAAVVVEDGVISSLFSRQEGALPEADEYHDYPEATLAPAYVDVHIHGAAGHDVMEATPEALLAVSRFLASRGTGSFLATTVTAPVDATLKSLEGLAKLLAQPRAEGEARPVGIHLEGPFLSHSKRGVHPPACLLEPNIALFDRFYDAAEGRIRLMTLAPELPGAMEFAAHATKRGVRVSIGHSNATAAETQAVIAAGACSATHTYNAMRVLDHREPGVLGTVLTCDKIYAELICDGIHNVPEMARLWWRAKGPDRAILVTDAMSATGMPDGEYKLGGFSVQVANGRAMADGVLAGSVLTLDHALENIIRFAEAPLEKALRALTVNPARMIGLEDQIGSLKVGRAADMVVVDASGRLVTSLPGGKPLVH